MKRIILLLGIIATAAACATNGNPVRASFTSEKCEGEAVGYTQTKVKYGTKSGKNYIQMKELSKAAPNSEFRLKLIPKPKKDWEDKEVCAKGVTAKSDANADWINGCAKAKDLTNGWFVVGCVPPKAEEGWTYKFDITVDDLGTLDPRIAVEY